MATEVRLPQLGQTMEEGTVVTTLVKVGDEVKKGDVLFEVETDQVTLELESPDDGFVKHIVAEVGETLPVGELLLMLGDKDEEVAAPAKTASAATAPAPVEAPKPKAAGKVIASPRAKKLAKDKGIDLATVKGTGPGGRIVEKDIADATAGVATSVAAKPKKAPEAPPAQYKLGQVVPLNRLQKITGRRMLQSKQEIPCFYLTVKVDMTLRVLHATPRNELIFAIMDEDLEPQGTGGEPIA